MSASIQRKRRYSANIATSEAPPKVIITRNDRRNIDDWLRKRGLIGTRSRFNQRKPEPES